MMANLLCYNHAVDIVLIKKSLVQCKLHWIQNKYLKSPNVIMLDKRAFHGFVETATISTTKYKLIHQ